MKLETHKSCDVDERVGPLLLTDWNLSSGTTPQAVLLLVQD